MVNGTLLNFGKRYEDGSRVIFDQWRKLHFGLDALSNQKILKGIMSLLPKHCHMWSAKGFSAWPFCDLTSFLIFKAFLWWWSYYCCYMRMGFSFVFFHFQLSTALLVFGSGLFGYFFSNELFGTPVGIFNAVIFVILASFFVGKLKCSENILWNWMVTKFHPISSHNQTYA